MEVLGGPLFGVAGAGESHGPAIVTTVFGCPPGLWVERAQIQHYLDRRRPGSNKLGTPRGKTTKSPCYPASTQKITTSSYPARRCTCT